MARFYTEYCHREVVQVLLDKLKGISPWLESLQGAREIKSQNPLVGSGSGKIQRIEVGEHLCGRSVLLLPSLSSKPDSSGLLL